MNAAAEDIWKILQEIAQTQKENKLEFKEIALRFKETDLKFKETDSKFKETDSKFKETDLMFKETDLRFKETDLRFKKTELEIEKVNQIVGRLGNKLGDYVEEMVRPAAVRLFRERGIDVHEVHRNIESKRGGEGVEIDLLVVNDNNVVAIECKSTLGLDDVNEHLDRLSKLKRLLPTYADKHAMGAVTGMVIPDNVAAYAYKKGLYVIAQSGDHLLIRNDAKFVPGIW